MEKSKDMTAGASPRIAVFPGTFHPFTIGHESIVRRALAMFDKVVVAVGYNEHKSDGREAGEALRAVGRAFAAEVGDGRVEAVTYGGLTVDLAKRLGACCILRGVRDVRDFEYERNLADVNRMVAGIETLVMFTLPNLACVSGSMVRELEHNGVDVSPFLAAPAESRGE